MSSKINLQTCEYACKSSIFQDNQLISSKSSYNTHIIPPIPDIKAKSPNSLIAILSLIKIFSRTSSASAKYFGFYIINTYLYKKAKK